MFAPENEINLGKTFGSIKRDLRTSLWSANISPQNNFHTDSYIHLPECARRRQWPTASSVSSCSTSSETGTLRPNNNNNLIWPADYAACETQQKWCVDGAEGRGRLYRAVSNLKKQLPAQKKIQMITKLFLFWKKENDPSTHSQMQVSRSGADMTQMLTSLNVPLLFWIETFSKSFLRITLEKNVPHI